MGAPSLTLRISRIVTGFAVVLSLSIPLHGPGHGMAGGHGSAQGSVHMGVDVAAPVVPGVRLGDSVGHHGSHPGEEHRPGHTSGASGEDGGSMPTSQASNDPAESDTPPPLCLCCPGPCACPPALALRTTGESCASLPASAARSVTRWAGQAPDLGPVPYARPWPTAPPTLGG